MLDIVIESRKAEIVPGFEVKRILPYQLRRMVGPFIFMDHGGPVSIPTPTATNLDVLPHPHIGLSTVSYLFSGNVTHRDSLGVEQVIRPGEVNWMTAGKGIAHSERFEDPAMLAGGQLELIQTWVALPEKDEESDPTFKNYTPGELPIFTENGIWMRLIAGNAYGLKNNVSTSSPLFYLHVVLDPGARFGLPKEHDERGVYIAKGTVEVNGISYTSGKLLVFTKGVDPLIIAKEKATLMMLGGEYLGERYIWWNFVSSRKERIEQAKEDWKQGRIVLPPNDHDEFVPLPKENTRPAGGRATDGSAAGGLPSGGTVVRLMNDLMNNNNLGTKPHYQILDGLRGVAAIIVVFFHLTEPLATSHLDNVINHGYLAVDFFFLLSGFVIGYAYDDRWDKLTVGGFLRRRFERLQPLVVLGMTLGAMGFYFTDSPIWPLIHTVPVWKLIVVMVIGWTVLPIPLSMDIRGWFEMHPLNSVGWSLFFEYIANILYALGLRKLSDKALAFFVAIAGAVLLHFAVTSPSGDIAGGWTLNAEHMRIGIIRTIFPFFAGLLLSRVARPVYIKNAFLWCSILVAAVLIMPRIGGAEHLWLNGLYEAFCIIIVFPVIIYLGASGEVRSETGAKICKFLGDVSYPLYMTHYVLVYFYVAWVSNHKGITLGQAWPYALLTFSGAMVLAYASLKWYDEPVRFWLRKKLK